MKQRLGIRRAIRWGIPIFVVLLVVIYGFISFTISSGITNYERKPQEDNPAAYGLQYQDVEFSPRGGDVSLSGWYITGEGEGPTLIFVHGIGSVRSGAEAVDIASRLAARGFSVLMFDLRGHGDSEGDFISGGYFERQDVLGAFDFLIRQGIPSESIGFIGFSMGAATTILAAAEEPDICALVADSPYADISDLIAQETARKTVFPEWLAPVFLPGVNLMAKVLYDIDIGVLVPEEAVKLLPYPIMIIHGTNDTRISLEHGTRVHDAAHPASFMWVVPGVDHVQSFAENPEEYVERVADYFDEQLAIEYE